MIQSFPLALAASTNWSMFSMPLSLCTQSRKVSSAIRATGAKVEMSTSSPGWRIGVV